MQERYKAIKSALEAYNQMDAETQQEFTAEYQSVIAAMNEYNAEVSKINGEFESANNLAAQIMVYGVSGSFMALVAIVVKRMLGR